MGTKLNVGDKVSYSATFLRSIGVYTGPMPFARGTIEKIDDFGNVALAMVNWDDEEIPPRVNIKNLVKVGSPQFQRGE